MRILKTAIAIWSVVSVVSAAPVSSRRADELPDGLPYPSPSELELIEQTARGTLPNGPSPPVISSPGILSLQLIAFNELFEVAFFNDLLANITKSVMGYRFQDSGDRDFVIKSLRAILAQEELHAISANNGLVHFDVQPIEPCLYKFPVHDFDSAIALASTFTDVALGTLQDVVERFALGHDVDLAREISAVIGQEGEQQGWYRVMQGKIPSALPFLTTSDLNFAFTAIQEFTVPGTCPNINQIPLRTFERLNVLTPPTARSQNLTFSFQDAGNETEHLLWMTYINQLNLPIVEPLHVMSRNGSYVEAQALFPYDDHEMNGLTVAAVTKSDGPFGDANTVAKWTLAGPGLIEVN
ncbi:hypothetical protein N7492_010417 [Penicillium capsulatum]|uniref:Late sexual development protein n=1 Tax=Penicillium capsulatum TaxID=69766 RepID=A0A9W9LF83_9EURO|nr:hypothetical protein N7492_010417 [Penicillium capsulatum]KAJ6112921.1 hypothetical protein N7512_008245 [Penicillium capsulatum]